MQRQHENIVNNKSKHTAVRSTNAIAALPNAVIQDDEIHNWPALHEAAAVGNEVLLASLLGGGMLRTAKEPKHGNTALHEAAWRGYSRCVALLCVPQTPTSPQQQIPAESVNKKISCMLRKRKKITQETQKAVAVHSILLSMQNHAGFTALHLAAQQGHNQSCRELLLAGADADIQNKYGDTALHTACRYGHAGATRILLSAACDANRLNLNGDTPLHISTAMRRRKLTRILLTEGDCNMSLKNAQNETPLDIAIRKSYVEIFDLLNNQERLRQQRKQRSKPNKPVKSTITASATAEKDGSSGKTNLATESINWSPYGCHYFPDPRAFPSPKLETLPKEPLQQGEQYYCDLNGCIRKGPIGVGSTCYCAPFFRHIEHKLNSNRRSLRKYVHNAKATLGHEVKALAERTNQQIEQLTRDMLCDRVRCESRRRHINYWLQVAAASQQHDSQHTDKKTPRTKRTSKHHDNNDDVDDGNMNEDELACGGMRKFSLSRCQSLDALSEHKSSIFMQLSNLRPNNAQSCSLLDDLPTSSRDKYITYTPTDKQSIAGEVGDNIVDGDDYNDHDNGDEARKLKEQEIQDNKFEAKYSNDHRIVDDADPQKSALHLVQEQDMLLGGNLLNDNTNFRLYETQVDQEDEESVIGENERVQILKEDKPKKQESRIWQNGESAHKFTIKAEIVQNGQAHYDCADSQEEKKELVTGLVVATPFVVTQEKMGTPSYAQLKKTLPAKLKTDMSHCEVPVKDLVNTMKGVHLTNKPMSAVIEQLTDSNTDEDDDVDVADDRLKFHEQEMDYLYELRKTLQTNNQDITAHVRAFEKPAITSSIDNKQNLTSNFSERVVPKNAYFHPLPNKMQYSSIYNNNSNNNNINNNDNNNNNNHYSNRYQNTNLMPMELTNNKSNRPQNILSLPESHSNGFLYHDAKLARRRPFIGHEHDQPLIANYYLSPVNSNSGSSIASSSNYESALKNAAIAPPALPVNMKTKASPHLHYQRQYYHHENQPTHLSNNNSEFVNLQPHAHVLGSLEPASSQLIYSANTVALALADGSLMEDHPEKTTNGVYPLISSLV